MVSQFDPKNYVVSSTINLFISPHERISTTMRRRFFTVLVGMAFALLACTLFTAPASALPSTGSSGDGSSSGPGVGAVNQLRRVHTDLVTPSGLPVGTTIRRGNYVDSNCIENVTPTSFDFTRAPGLFDSCSYESSSALIEYVVTLPTGQVAVKWISFRQVNVSLLNTKTYVEPGCSQGDIQCRPGPVAIFNGDNSGQADLYPRVYLGPALPAAPDGFTYCTAEGYTCTAPAGREVRFGNASSNRTAQIPAAGSIKCDSQTFGGTDPVPDRLKQCYYRSN